MSDAGAVDRPAPRLPSSGERWALFLDVDGTLAPIERDPASVRCPPDVLTLLTDATRWCDGALAVVSGRSLADLDRILDPLRPWAAGVHGLQWRGPGASAAGDGAGDARREAVLSAAQSAIRRGFSCRSGILVEHKGVALAVHYRERPEAGEAVRQCLERFADAHWSVRGGKMVWELMPREAGKAAAIERFMAEAPFAGRWPVFVGDDLTDEDGFEAVLRRGGLAVKVGDGPSIATHGLPGPQAVAEWLQACVALPRAR